MKKLNFESGAETENDLVEFKEDGIPIEMGMGDGFSSGDDFGDDENSTNNAQPLNQAGSRYHGAERPKPSTSTCGPTGRAKVPPHFDLI